MRQDGSTKDGSKPMIPQDDDLLLDEPHAAEAKRAPKLDPREFRGHLGCFATGVTVITALGHRGQKLGVTANSFNSVSLDPPLVLFSLDRRAYSLWDFLSTGHFAVNVLAEDQAELSTRFARPRSDKWSGIRWATWDHGCPILLGCHANFECSIAYTHAGGDHVIFVGQVERMGSDAEKAPLLYYRGGYRSLASA
jgi:flavin reductase (DIM6/NTAB) family NADH-FMN oxidoreductase RutF